MAWHAGLWRLGPARLPWLGVMTFYVAAVAPSGYTVMGAMGKDMKNCLLDNFLMIVMVFLGTVNVFFIYMFNICAVRFFWQSMEA